MSIESDIFDTLKGLVGNRMVRTIFPQSPPELTWPAIRYARVSGVPFTDICGSGDEATDELRVQLTLVAKTPAAVDSLRAQVIAAMDSFSPPATRDFCGPDLYDEQRRTYYATLDYLFHGSS